MQERTADLIAANEQLQQQIDERLRIEEALQESEQRFRDLVENSLMGISIIQKNQIVYQNPAHKKLLGFLPETLNLDVLEQLHPDDAEKMKRSYQDVLRPKTLCVLPERAHSSPLRRHNPPYL